MTDSRLSTCVFSITPSLLNVVNQQLQQGDFSIHIFQDEAAFREFVIHEELQIDCLILEDGTSAERILAHLGAENFLLPCVLIAELSPSAPDDAEQLENVSLYHQAVQHLSSPKIADLSTSVKEAINEFLRLPASLPLLGDRRTLSAPSLSKDIFTSLSNKQRQLSVKLQERLGYLGVYYKRDPNAFLKRMKLEEKQAFLTTLRQDYRDIILNYFSDEPDLNQKIDRYVTTAFFADVPTAQMVQIHMELMDEFSKQLKLEGRNEEILLDYRLTLIDMLANLCELYRRSIPRL